MKESVENNKTKEPSPCLTKLYNEENDEIFKWKAVKTWQKEWNKPSGAFSSFAERYKAAKKDFSILIDTSHMHPSSGLIKLWEKEPETVEHLFCDVLLGDAQGDIARTQELMEKFLEEYEALRRKYYPGNWSFKQDRHSASVYLAANSPAEHFIFKSSEAHKMAKYIDFGFTIGTGADFSLENYYKLCDEIIAAMKEHESLLEKHFSYLTEDYYRDESLHLLAFDLIYCCRTYNYYKDLIVPSTGKTIKKKIETGPSAEELAQKEAEKQAKIAALQDEIDELERFCEDFEDISLLGVQVTSEKYGVGTVIDQQVNKIKVAFPETKIKFVLDKKFSARPRFENDEEIVETFTKYGRAQEKIKKLLTQIEYLQK